MAAVTVFLLGVIAFAISILSMNVAFGVNKICQELKSTNAQLERIAVALEKEPRN